MPSSQYTFFHGLGDYDYSLTVSYSFSFSYGNHSSLSKMQPDQINLLPTALRMKRKLPRLACRAFHHQFAIDLSYISHHCPSKSLPGGPTPPPPLCSFLETGSISTALYLA